MIIFFEYAAPFLAALAAVCGFCFYVPPIFPDAGNFIAFPGNVTSRSLLRKAAW